MKTLQYFDAEYLDRCANMTPDDIAQFLDDFRQLHDAKILANKNRS